MIRRYVIELGRREHEVAVEQQANGTWIVTREGTSLTWDAKALGNHSWSLQPGTGGGTTREIDVDHGKGGARTITSGELIGVAARILDPLHRAAEKAAAARPAGPAEVKSPMAGKIIRALVQVGDAVTTGQSVIVVEAMKMENELKAPRDGVIREVRGNEGQTIEAGQILVVMQ